MQLNSEENTLFCRELKDDLFTKSDLVRTNENQRNLFRPTRYYWFLNNVSTKLH